MPSPATTSVTLGSILDLIGPLASPPSGGKDQTSFDSLLQPPQPRSDRQPPHEADVRRLAPSTSRQDQQQQDASHSAVPPAAAILHASESSNGDQRSSAAPAGQNDSQPATATSSKVDDSAHKQEQAQREVEAVVESLAGLVAVAPITAEIQPTTDEASSAEAIDTVTIEPGAARGKPSAAATQRTAVPGTAGKPQPIAAENVALKSPAELNAQQAEAQKIAARQASAQRGPSATSGQHAVIEKLDTADVTKEHDLIDDGRAASDIAASGGSAEQPAGDIQSQDRESLASEQRGGGHNADTQPAATEPTVPTSLTRDLASTPAAQTPTVSAVSQATQITAAETPNGTAEARPDVSVTPAAPPQRSRLPAEVLAPGAAATNRRTSVEIDTTRLLTRVARAFATAQERDGEVHLRLSPPELGSLRLEVRVQDGALVARLQTETDAARTAILENLPALRDRLADQGVRIERFDVDLMQRQPGGMADQPGSRQQDTSAAPPRVAPPPRARPETPVSPRPSLLTAGSADGLNVIV